MKRAWGTLILPKPALAQSDAGRDEMVRVQIEDRGVRHPGVLAAMREIPREEFLNPDQRGQAFEDSPQPLSHGQTISQPYIVALMTQGIDPKPGDRVLEVGTGSGYQAAVLSRLAGEVFTVEIVEPLAGRARETLRRLGLGNVHIRTGDGFRGWPEEAPFDAILVACAPSHIPEELIHQLKEGGRMVIPVGSEREVQELLLLTKEGGKVRRERLLDVRFVPMTGEAEKIDAARDGR